MEQEHIGKMELPPQIHPMADPYPKTEFEPLNQRVHIERTPSGLILVDILFDVDGRELVDAESFRKEAEHWAAMIEKSLMACSRKPRDERSEARGALTNGNKVTLNSGVNP